MRRGTWRGVAVLGFAATVGLGVVAAATAQPAEEGEVRTATAPIEGAYLIQLAADQDARATTEQASTLTMRYGGEVSHIYRTVLHGFAVRGMSAESARRLAADPAVAAVTQDGRGHGAESQQNPPSWGLDRVDQPDLPLDSAYGYENAGAGVTVYDVDSGIRASHQDFGGRAESGPDFVGDGQGGEDCHGHGTHTAGTAAGSTFGLAKESRIVSVRVLGCDNSGSDSGILAGLDWVAGHAGGPSVVNFSIYLDSAQVGDEAKLNLINAGVVLVEAAGNNNVDACVTSAHLAESIVVGATDATDRRAEFSNWGECVDLFAPGVAITSAAHDSDDGSTDMQGTSMATPHVTGAAALYLSTHPEAVQAEVEQALIGSATPDHVADPGAGSPNLLLRTGA